MKTNSGNQTSRNAGSGIFKSRWTLMVSALVIAIIATVGLYTNSQTPENRTLYVNQSSSGNCDGSSWADAFQHPQDALTIANAGDQVWVAKGVYSANDDTPFMIPAGVKVYGGFAGSEATLESRDIAANQTVFASSDMAATVTGDSGAILDGITVQGGIDGALAYFPPENAPAQYLVTLSYQASAAPAAPQIITDSEEEVSVQVSTTAVDGDSFLIAANGTPTRKIRIWIDVDNDDAPIALAADERGIEVTTVSTGDGVSEIASKLAHRINLDSALSATVAGAVVTIKTMDPFEEVSENSTSDLIVSTTDSTPTVVNPAVFGTPYSYDEDTVITFSIDDSVAGPENFVGWRVVAGETLSSAPTFTYTLKQNIQLEAVYLGLSDIIHVDTLFGDDANGGTSWVDAYKTLTYALAQEVLRDDPDDEIWVANGYYAESVTMVNGQRVFGGFAGDADGFLPDTGETSRDGRVFDTTADGHYLPVNETVLTPTSNHIVTAADDMILDGVVLEGGRAEMPGYPNNRGGGILCTTGSPTIVNCVFRHNYALLYGGALYALLGTPTITNCVFTDNMAHRGGAAFCDSLSFLTFTNCTFKENIAADGALGMYFTENVITALPTPGWGGAIFNQNAALTIEGCNFIGNYMNMCGSGGAIYNNSTDTTGNKVQISNSVFLANKAQMHVTYNGQKEIVQFNYGYGGAIYNRASSPSVTNCQFGNYQDGMWNSSTRDGGAVCNVQGSKPDFVDCLFVNNRAFLTGGAVYNQGASTGGAFTGCTFVDNTAPYGGAVYNDGAQTQFVDSAFENNECYESQICSWQKSNFTPGFMGSYASIPASTTTPLVAYFLGGAVPDYFAGYSATEGTGVMPIITEPLPDWFGVTGPPGTEVSTLPDVDGYFGGTGAAIYNDDASPTISGCEFKGHVGIHGSAIYCGRAQISLDPDITAEEDGGEVGPSEGVGGTIAIVGSSFESNQSVEKGGALYISKNYKVNMSGTTFGVQGNSSQGNQAGADPDLTLAIIQDPSVVPLRDVYAYTGGWNEITPLPVGRKNGRVVRVKEGDEDWLYFIGGVGWNRTSRTDFVSNYVWKKSLKGGGWIVVQNLPVATHSFAAVYGGDRKIYVFGGYTATGNNGATDAVHVLDLDAPGFETWSTIAPMDEGTRAQHGATLVESVAPDASKWSRIHLLGGTAGIVWTYWLSGGPGAGLWTKSGDVGVSLTYQGTYRGGLCWAASNGRSVYAVYNNIAYKAIDNLGGAPIDPPLTDNRTNRFVPLTAAGITGRGAPFVGGYTSGTAVLVGGAIDANQQGITQTLTDATDENAVTTTGASWNAGPSYPGVPWQQMGATCEGGSMHVAGGTGRVVPPASGGGVYNNGILTVSNCQFDYNVAAPQIDITTFGKGGAIFSAGGSLTVDKGTIFRNNVAGRINFTSTALGGGVCSEGDDEMAVSNSTFENNYTSGWSSNGSTEGAGLYVSGTSQALIDSCIFQFNHTDGGTTGYGGAVSSTGVPALTIKDCTFDSNEVLNAIVRPSLLSYGGGLCIRPGGSCRKRGGFG